MDIEALKRAAARTFEELCFLDAQPASAKTTRVPGRAASVRFRGPSSGTLTVRLPEAALREAAENMLGPEATESSQALDDVVCEITNVVCGHVLPLLAGPSAVFDIEAPALGDEAGAGRGDDTAELSIGGFVASVSLAIRPAA
jgi:CheY-specific phosphatase CheX